MKIGIVGQGSFGRFATELLSQDANIQVVTHDKNASSSLEEVARADIIILCVPLAAYSEVLGELAPILKPATLVVDICSVKVESEKRVRAALPNHKNLLISHPMFGPETAKNGLSGLSFVVCAAEGDLAEKAVKYCEDKFGLRIVRMTSEEHDREMADMHALTYFIARGLTELPLRESNFHAPSYKRLLDLSALDKKHSEDLFRTMEVGNPYAKSAREKFMKTLQQINERLDKEQI